PHESRKDFEQFLSKPFLLGAHRGGGFVWPENTLVAFTEAAKTYPGILLEADARLTADGHIILRHDDTVNRTTNGTGRPEEMTLAELKALDAAYNFTLDGGKTFPYRGKGLTIPTLEEALQAVPNERFQIEAKGGPKLMEAIVEVIRRNNAGHRVLLCSFFPESMARLREIAPDLARTFDFDTGKKLLHALWQGDWDNYQPSDHVLSMMQRHLQEYSLTQEEIRAVRAKGILFQIHTPNDEASLRKYLALGVDSILTDRPDLLAGILAEKHQLSSIPTR
ncbi:MAG: glycerophosphodiester phosphodiesterase family protein, partial [Candidatus Hydrogenedentes bacterium]|nr:glycerophosphodiester phosphodiesterase family protein [Candidatus Hydrogenedentota bacterium]